MSRYVINLTAGNARRLETWLGGALEIGPVNDPGAALIASLDAITDEEFEPIRQRLAEGRAHYHHQGAHFASTPPPPAHHGPAPHAPPA